MSSNIDFKKAFFNGKKHFKNYQYEFAKYWFSVSVQDPELKEMSLYFLIKIDLINGRFFQARELLNSITYDTIKFNLLYGTLESIENNYEQSKKYYYECLNFPELQYLSLLKLANLHMQTGDYEISRKMLETTILNPEFYVQSNFLLIYLNILEYEFYEAQKLLGNISTSNLNKKAIDQIFMMEIYIKYFLGELRMSDCKGEMAKRYTIKRLFNSDEDVLLDHINRHLNQKYRGSKGCFFDFLDTKKLLHNSMDRIKYMNGNHFGISDMYRLRLDSSIGYMGDIITNDVCVTTIIGTKEILTIHPILLSSEFDKEGFSMSEELRLKRSGVRYDK